MVVLYDLDLFHFAGDVIDRVPILGSRAAYAKQFLRDKLQDHKKYIYKHGEDFPEIRNWKWSRGGTRKGKALAGEDARA
jgi:xylulose-5-phosphate/fructose-6-phosphate phosphoketolase